jgi:hypothetical protein
VFGAGAAGISGAGATTETHYNYETACFMAKLFHIEFRDIQNEKSFAGKLKVQYCAVQYSREEYSTVGNSTAQQGTSHHITAQHSAVQCSGVKRRPTTLMSYGNAYGDAARDLDVVHARRDLYGAVRARRASSPRH